MLNFFMNGVFDFNGRNIGFERTDDSLKFLATNPRELDLALYYIETHPDFRGTIKTERVSPLPETGNVEKFIPWQIQTPFNSVAYFSYNYVLLNANVKHDFSEVANRYLRFFQGLKDQRRRKVEFLEFDYEILSLLPRLPCFHQGYANDGFVCQFNNGEMGSKVTTIMFQAQNFTKGLRNLFGFDSKYRLESQIEERIALE